MVTSYAANRARSRDHPASGPKPLLSVPPIFTSRLSGRRLLDSEGLAVGRVRDVVVLHAVGQPPRAIGLVVTFQRRRIFVNLGRVAEMSTDGVYLDGSSVDLNRFRPRPGEILASDLYDRQAGDGVVMDVGIAPAETGPRRWEVTVLAIGLRRGLRRQTSTVVPWYQHRELFDIGSIGNDIASLRDMHPTDLASMATSTPAVSRQLADALHDEELADVLEEMSEQDQIRFLASLGMERIIDIVEQMEPDDAVDLLGQLPSAERARLLAGMSPGRAAELRRLLAYDATSAGGLMTSRPLIVTPDEPVAEVLARMRQPTRGATEAAQAYVCEPPAVTPTGPYIGTARFQRLLREPPAAPVGQCIEESGFVGPDLPDREVAARLAAYNLIGVAVCDDAGRLVGAVTVDDVLDRLLPADWRKGGA